MYNTRQKLAWELIPYLRISKNRSHLDDRSGRVSSKLGQIPDATVGPSKWNVNRVTKTTRTIATGFSTRSYIFGLSPGIDPRAGSLAQELRRNRDRMPETVISAKFCRSAPVPNTQRPGISVRALQVFQTVGYIPKDALYSAIWLSRPIWSVIFSHAAAMASAVS